MPLLYGEGLSAFKRLQEEILRGSADESFFAWGYGRLPRGEDFPHGHSLFAIMASNFFLCGGIVSATPEGLRPSHYTMTNKGLYIETSICYLPIEGRLAFARVNCAEYPRERAEEYLAIALVQSKENDMMFSRPY